jgi:hypothetical protein
MLSEILRAALDELRDSKDDPLAAIDEVAAQLEAGRAGWAEYVFGQPSDDTTAVLFHWSTRWGKCQECGAPAAFYSLGADGPDNPAKLCAVCAANDAVDGFTIVRIGPDGASWAHDRQADVLNDSAPATQLPVTQLQP